MAGPEARVMNTAASSRAPISSSQVSPYIPPFRQQRLDAAGGEKTDTEMQQREWTRMKKSINSVVNRVNEANIRTCVIQLFRLNLIRGRGVFCKSLLRAQSASPGFSPVFACLVAVVNTRMPEVAALLVARLVAQLRKTFDMSNKALCLTSAKFLACLFNQQVINEVVLLEFFGKSLETPSDKTIEYVVSTLQDSAPFLADKASRALEVVFQNLREVLHDGEIGRKAQVMVEDLMNMRKKRFAGLDELPTALNLVEDDDIITHFATFEEEEETDLQDEWNSFIFDPEYEANEKAYEEIKRDILGAEYRPQAPKTVTIVEPVKVDDGKNETKEVKEAEKPLDMTNADLVDFRRTIYLSIGSGLSFEEWAHKLIRLMRNNKGRELEMCKMIVESCSQEKTFNRSYGLLGQRFCLLERVYVEAFEEIFATQYATIHRLDTRKIRNTACFFASLLASETLPWNVMQIIRLVEEETTSSSRIFLKILFQEMSTMLGATKFQECLQNPETAQYLTGVFPTDSAQNARFSINFFTSVGLGYVTEALREKLDTLPKEIAAPAEDSDSSSSLSSSSLSSSSLSPSSGEENPNNSAKDGARVNGKRPNEATSPDPLDLPAKARRRSFDISGYGQRSEERSRISGEKRPGHISNVMNGSSDRREPSHRPRVTESIPDEDGAKGRASRRIPSPRERRDDRYSTKDDASRSTTRKRRREYSPTGPDESESKRQGSRLTRRRHRYEYESSDSDYDRSGRARRSQRSYDRRHSRSGIDNESVRERRSGRRRSDSGHRRRERSPVHSRRRTYSYTSSSDSLDSYDSLLDDRRYSRRRAYDDSESDLSEHRRDSRRLSTRSRHRSVSSHSSDDRLSLRSRSISPPRRRHRRSRRRSSFASYGSGDDRHRHRRRSSGRLTSRGSSRRDDDTRRGEDDGYDKRPSTHNSPSAVRRREGSLSGR